MTHNWGSVNVSSNILGTLLFRKSTSMPNFIGNNVGFWVDYKRIPVPFTQLPFP